jgi:hypothetical protein
MPDKIQSYRQPMVTAAGIYLGFVLNFASAWTTKAFTRERNTDIVIAFGLIASIILLLIVLYRILNMNYPAEKAVPYYQRTLICLVSGIGVSFLAIIIVLIESFLLTR